MKEVNACKSMFMCECVCVSEPLDYFYFLSSTQPNSKLYQDFFGGLTHILLSHDTAKISEIQLKDQKMLLCVSKMIITKKK